MTSQDGYDVYDVLYARELSIQRAIRDQYGAEITELVLPASSGDDYNNYAGRLMSLVGDFSMCAQDAASLMWFEILEIIAEGNGAHFCGEPDECSYGNHDD